MRNIIIVLLVVLAPMINKGSGFNISNNQISIIVNTDNK